MIINLAPDEMQRAALFHERIKKCYEKYNIPLLKITDAEGLQAIEQFNDDIDALLEIYEPYFKAARRSKVHKKGRKYLESIVNLKLHC